jgi:hypothetical protein
MFPAVSSAATAGWVPNTVLGSELAGPAGCAVNTSWVAVPAPEGVIVLLVAGRTPLLVAVMV